jgi:galactitol-specific phosphotransferase system IIC component
VRARYVIITQSLEDVCESDTCTTLVRTKYRIATMPFENISDIDIIPIQSKFRIDAMSIQDNIGINTAKFVVHTIILVNSNPNHVKKMVQNQLQYQLNLESMPNTTYSLQQGRISYI